jgi:hypothetical protein
MRFPFGHESITIFTYHRRAGVYRQPSAGRDRSPKNRVSVTLEPFDGSYETEELGQTI